jgi:hypothetical protein
MSKSLIRKVFCNSEIRIIDEKKHIAEAVMSDETLDRYDEVIEAAGYKNYIKQFMKHPVLLSSHKYGGDLRAQIGQWVDVRIEGKKLVGNPMYYVDEGNPEADWAWNLVGKKIAAFSVGIIPRKVETMDYEKWSKLKEAGKRVARRRYLEQELIETSQVLIPANPSALQRAIAEGDDVERDVAIFYFSNLDQIKGFGDVEIIESDVVDKFLIKDPALDTTDDKEIEESVTLGEEVTPLGVIPYNKMPCADEDTSWDGPSEVAKASVDDLKKMCAWFASPGDKKGDYKLPHHTKDGYKTVKRGVMNAMARLGMTKMPSSDKPGVKKHLERHYSDFGMMMPSSKNEKLWDEFLDSCEKEELVLSIEQMKELFSEEELSELKDYMELLEMLNRGWDETENEIRHRIKDPGLFSKFRYAVLQKKSPKVFAVYGQLKSSTKWAIQALRFPKGEGWTVEKAKAWAASHPVKIFVEEIETTDLEMMSMMDVNAVTDYLEQLTTELTLLKESIHVMFSAVGEEGYIGKITKLIDDKLKHLVDTLTTLFNVKNVIPNETYLERILENKETDDGTESILKDDEAKSLKELLLGMTESIQKLTSKK